jgi:uncharacterized protein (TIGR03086 family)
MALDLPVVHDRALAATRMIVAGVGDEQWSHPTPCPDWNVRQLVNHIVSGNWWAAELAAGSTIDDVGDRLDGDQLGDDPSDAYARSAAAAQAAFAAPWALDAPCAVSYGPVPGAVYAGHRFIDVLIHGWDIAVASGQPADLDPELVERCWAEVEPQLDLLRGSGMFGTLVAADGDRTASLLAALGRSPGAA